MARKRVAALRRNRAASRVAATWRGRKERRAYVIQRTNAVTIQKVQRRRAAAVLYEKMATEAREQAKLENRLAAMEANGIMPFDLVAMLKFGAVYVISVIAFPRLPRMLAFRHQTIC